jgi:amino-acid N-acetyltransferase
MQREGVSRGPGLSSVQRLLALADLPTSDLTESHCGDFFFTGDAAAPTGIVGLELYGEAALLRSLIVSPAIRGTGLGTTLVAFAENFARSSGVREIYLLTMTAEAFFLALGYERARRESAPACIQSTREFSGICPDSSAFLTKKI